MGIRGVTNLGGRSAEDLEREASGLEPGWFRARMEDVSEEEDNLKLKFRLADGRVHTETLWSPMNAENDKAAAALEKRRGAFSIRLGLVPREAKGTAYEFDWLACMGREYAIHLVLGKPNKEGKQFIQLEWMGIFDVFDHRVPEAIRGPNPKATGITATGSTAMTASINSTPASAAVASSGGGPQQQPLNMDDL